MAIDQALFAKTSQDVPGDQPRKDLFFDEIENSGPKATRLLTPRNVFFPILSAPKATRLPTQGCAVGRTTRVTCSSLAPPAHLS